MRGKGRGVGGGEWDVKCRERVGRKGRGSVEIPLAKMNKLSRLKRGKGSQGVCAL